MTFSEICFCILISLIAAPAVAILSFFVASPFAG